MEIVRSLDDEKEHISLMVASTANEEVMIVAIKQAGTAVVEGSCEIFLIMS